MSLSNIIRPISECNKPVIKIAATPSCENSIGGIIDGSEGVTSFDYRIVTNLKGFITDIPREIIRQNSKNCRVQRTQSVVKYQLQGADVYPAWKMREIEEMFMQEKIEIDGQEVLYSGGTIFTKVGQSCEKMFTLNTVIEECQTVNIFGCVANCTSPTNVFIIPPNIIDPTFYGDNGVLIANNYSQLLAYYSQQSGVVEVADIDSVLGIQCGYYKIFSVTTVGAIPPAFYYSNTSANNKVFPVALDSGNPDYNKLCRGIDNDSCAFPIIEPPFVYELVCGDITIGEITQFSIGMSCGLVLFGDWEQHTGDTDITTLGNTRTINLSVINPNYVPVSGVAGTFDKTIASEMEGCSVLTPIPLTAVITNVEVNSVLNTDWSFDTMTGYLSFSPCIENGDELHVDFMTAATIPIVTGEVIAQINGTNCLPKTNIYQNNTNNSSIPAGSTLIIKTNGDIQWVGSGTSADGSGTVIEVTDIIYEII